jgi:ATP/maltotriose-dependent transcriptional regulator MalT
LARELEALEREQDTGPFLEASVTLLRGEIARLRGDLDEALAFTSDAREQFRALGGYVMVGGSDQLIARLHLLAGDPARARDLLLTSDAAFERVGDRGFRSTTLAMLAQVRELLGDHEGAGAAIELCEEIGGHDDVINYAITHAVRARLALAERNSEAAERWARSAVARAFETDFTFVRGETLLTLAFVLEQLGRREQSMSEARTALELYEAKCDRLGASQARALLERLGALA